MSLEQDLSIAYLSLVLLISPSFGKDNLGTIFLKMMSIKIS